MEDVLLELGEHKPERARGKIVRATRVEDGHSATQDAIYWYLWRSGKPIKGSRSHFVQMGYGQIERGLKINRSNVQDSIKELQKKFSVRVFKESTVGSATIYEVFCCDDVLAQREAAGFRWAFRYGARRAELRREPGEGSTPIGSPPAGLPPVGLTPLVATRTDRSPIGVSPTAPIGLAPIQLANKQSNSEVSSSSVAVVQKALADATGEVVDDDAARQLIAGCQAVAADATDEEIAFFTTAKARKLRHLGGLLLAVPKCFEPVCLTNHRQRREFERQEREEEAEKWAQVAADSRVQYQRWLDDPETPPEMREIARKLLN